jgi:hypothetical protein
MRSLLYEHNTLNGFWFALIEFLLVATVCLFLSILEVLHRHIFWSIAYFGIAFNSGTICATVIEQMRRGERSNTWAETYWPKYRESIHREHPDMGRHTLQIVTATIVPFLLAVLIFFSLTDVTY